MRGAANSAPLRGVNEPAGTPRQNDNLKRNEPATVAGAVSDGSPAPSANLRWLRAKGTLVCLRIRDFGSRRIAGHIRMMCIVAVWVEDKAGFAGNWHGCSRENRVRRRRVRGRFAFGRLRNRLAGCCSRGPSGCRCRLRFHAGSQQSAEYRDCEEPCKRRKNPRHITCLTSVWTIPDASSPRGWGLLSRRP